MVLAMWITFKPLSTAIDSRQYPGERERVAEPGDMPLMLLFMIWCHALIGQMSSVMLTDSRCCWQYRALSRSRSYNSGKDFFNTDFEQAIQISLRGFSLVPRLQEEQKKYACDLLQKEEVAFKVWLELFLYSPFINYDHIYKAIDLWTDVQKVQYCNHTPTKSLTKPINQWIYAKNAFCAQLLLVLRAHVNQNCTEIPHEQFIIPCLAFTSFTVSEVRLSYRSRS